MLFVSVQGRHGCEQSSSTNDVQDPPTQVKVRLIWKIEGVDVFVGQSGNELCPIDTIVAYSAVRGNAPGPIKKAIHFRKLVS